MKGTKGRGKGVGRLTEDPGPSNIHLSSALVWGLEEARKLGYKGVSLIGVYG